MKDLYTAHVRVTGGRDGAAKTPDGLLDVKMAFPKALGGAGDGVNPEQLFGAGYAGCFTSSIKAAAKTLGLDAGEVATEAAVTVTVTDDGRYGLRVALDVAAPGVPAASADAVIAEAKRICAYSNATRGNVDVSVRLNA